MRIASTVNGPTRWRSASRTVTSRVGSTPSRRQVSVVVVLPWMRARGETRATAGRSIAWSKCVCPTKTASSAAKWRATAASSGLARRNSVAKRVGRETNGSNATRVPSTSKTKPATPVQVSVPPIARPSGHGRGTASPGKIASPPDGAGRGTATANAHARHTAGYSSGVEAAPSGSWWRRIASIR